MMDLDEIRKKKSIKAVIDLQSAPKDDKHTNTDVQITGVSFLD